MNKLGVVAGVLLATVGAGRASDEGAVRLVGSDGNARVSYIGDDIRIGVGIDSEGELQGEYLHVFGKRDKSNWIGELWVADERGGLKLNYHWLNGASSREQAALHQDDVRVGKVFVAVDRNQDNDRKATLGVGFEGPLMFWGAYVMKSTTGSRLVSETIDTETTRLTGTIGNQQFVQDQFTDTITRVFHHPYDQGVGVRVGRYFDDHLVRLRGGLDYEEGRFSADQVTLSLGAEKFFAGTGHSVALDAEYLSKSGDFEVDDDDVRAILWYRYSFGQSYQPRRAALERRTEVPVPAVPEVREKRLIKNDVTVSETALFDLDRSAIRPDATGVLDGLVARLGTLELAGPIRITGHTCDLASDEYNMGLSRRRAEAAAGYLSARGVDPAKLEIRWLGESSPRVPNDGQEANRRLNRRVEIEFVSIEEITEDVVVKAAVPSSTGFEWRREEIDDPAWLERALKNPVRHKREVDTYRFVETATETRLGPQIIVNTFPGAADDTAVTDQEQPVVIDVLANDSDPDGDALSVIALTQPGSGMAALNADQSVTYTPNAGFFGIDTFGYTIADPGGGQSMATVTVTVIERPPAVANDDAASTLRTQPVTIDVLVNDQGQGLSVTQVASPANGTASLQGGQVVYTPERAFVGTDTFTYQATDQFGQTDEARVTVTVAPFNQDPVAVGDAAVTAKETPVVIDVLANDFDPDGDPLTIVAVTETTPFGRAEITPDNRVLYVPNPGWWGGDELSYTIDDGFGGQATATVVLEVIEQ